MKIEEFRSALFSEQYDRILFADLDEDSLKLLTLDEIRECSFSLFREKLKMRFVNVMPADELAYFGDGVIGIPTVGAVYAIDMKADYTSLSFAIHEICEAIIASEKGARMLNFGYPYTSTFDNIKEQGRMVYDDETYSCPDTKIELSRANNKNISEEKADFLAFSLHCLLGIQSICPNCTSDMPTAVSIFSESSILAAFNERFGVENQEGFIYHHRKKQKIPEKQKLAFRHAFYAHVFELQEMGIIDSDMKPIVPRIYIDS